MPRIQPKKRHKVAPQTKVGKVRTVLNKFKIKLPRPPVVHVDDDTLERYKALFDHVDTPVWIGDKDGNTLYANPRLCELTGYSKNEIFKKHELDLWTEDGAKIVEKTNHTDRQKGISSTYEADILTKSGDVIPVRVSGTPLSNGGTMAFLTSMKEVKTKQASLSRRLNELNALYNVHAHTRMISPLKTVLKDITKDLYLLSHNKRYAQVEVVFDKHVHRLPRLRRKASTSIRWPIMIKSRTRGHISIGYAAKAKIDHDLLGEERKILAQVAETLARHIESREIIEANRHLQSLNDLKDEFIAVTSHELRSPITSIKGYLSFLIDQASRDEIPYESKRYLMRAYHSVQTLNNLVNNILDVSRLQSGRFNLHFAPADVLQILTTAIDQMEVQAAENEVTLEYRNMTGENELIAKIDEVRIGQVFRNILGNAIKFSRPGTKVRILVSKRAGQLEVIFKDQGVGIAKKDIPTIFDKFIQTTNSQESFKGGTGLGLFISRQIIQHHDGRIWLESEPNVGTTVTIHLPLKHSQ